MAVASKNVRADCIDAGEFPDLARQYRVMAVPKVVINDRVQFEGALPEREFLKAVLEAVGSNGEGRA
jgi:predicted DsbA family dithiol-disulfide isomerase